MFITYEVIIFWIYWIKEKIIKINFSCFLFAF